MVKYILLLIIIRWLVPGQQEKHLFRIMGNAQGTSYSISYINKDSIIGKAEVDSIFRAIDLSLSLYKSGSLISRFNREGFVQMDEHMKNVVGKSLYLWKASGGCFDITVKNLVDLWGFGVQGKGRVPSRKLVRRALQKTGSEYLQIRNDTLFAVKDKIQIDCNGIAQGYSVDVVFGFLESKGINDLLVEIGGEIRAKGRNADGEYWRIGLESPSGITEEWYPVEKIINVQEKAVTTSGNYRKYFMDKGKKYTHIIDPRKGRPVDNGIISVTVIGLNAITADGWDNGFYVMGVDSSFAHLKKNPGLDIRIIYEDKNGIIRDTASAGFKELIVK